MDHGKILSLVYSHMSLISPRHFQSLNYLQILILIDMTRSSLSLKYAHTNRVPLT